MARAISTMHPRLTATILLMVALPILAFPQVNPLIKTKAVPFTDGSVRLLNGPCKAAQDANERWLLSLDPDRLASRFRSEAGLNPKAPNYPGWEDVQLPGVGMGYYLSGCSWLYASTQDERLLGKVKYALKELDECQKANRDGFLLATKGGHKLMAEIAQGDIRFDGGWLLNGQPEPYYAMEKLFAGLRDAYRNCHQPLALQIEQRLGDWLERQMANLNDKQMQKIMACEFGGMNWVLSDLYADTGDKRYLDLSRRWTHLAILDPLSRGVDCLPGIHANTQFPKICGFAARYEYGGDPADYQAASFFWHRVVYHHSYVTGGNSESEHFGQPDHLNDRLSAADTESCNTYNILRLTRLLFRYEPRAEYAEFYERALYNHALAGQDPTDGRVCYFLPLASGYTKPFQSLYGIFSCCTCTAMENHARHWDFVYMHGTNDLYVNLYTPSELKWREQGLTLTQNTDFPRSGVSTLTFQCRKPLHLRLFVRCPAWTSGITELELNGRLLETSAQPGSYAIVDRKWRTGDKLRIAMPMAIHAEAMPDNPNRIALLKGPIVLAGYLGQSNETMDQTDEDIPVLLQDGKPIEEKVLPIPDSPLGFALKTADSGLVPLKPLYAIRDQRYAVYWDMMTAAQIHRREAAFEADRKRRKELDDRTVDRVEIAVEKSESAHSLRSERSNTGFGAYGKFKKTRWRDAQGWFEYEMKVLPDAPNILMCTFWGGELGSRVADILVDGAKLATISLDSNHPEGFYDLCFDIPEAATQGRSKVVVRFEAHPGNTAGGLFGLRTVKGK